MVLEIRLPNINSRWQARVTFAREHHVLISNNTQVRKSILMIFDSNMMQKGNGTLLLHFSKDYFAVDVDRRKYLLQTSSNRRLCTHYTGNMFYHKFSHSVVS